MINVLDHVCDAELCLRSAIRLTKPGGWFVCGQDLSDQTDRQWLVDAPGRDGHPITLDKSLMRAMLGSTFNAHIDRVLTRAEDRAPDAHYGTFIFAGVKCAEPAPQSPEMSVRSECRGV